MKPAETRASCSFPAAPSNQVRCPPGKVFDDSRTGILQDLEEKMTQLERLRAKVEDEMEALLRRFQESAVRGLLQLFVLRKGRGSPPSWLYWARLSRKQSEFDGPSGRPRWHRRLKIRKRSDLSNAIHWVGLDGRRGEILRFHQPVQALNAAHKAVFHASAYLKRVYRQRFVRELPGMPDEEEALAHLTGPPRWGSMLREAAWKLQAAVETATLEMERCFESSLQLGGPFVLVPESRHLGVCRSYWLDRAYGSIHQGLDGRMRRHPQMTPERISGYEQVEARRRRAQCLQRRALRVYHSLSDRILRGLFEARRVLSTCVPLGDDPARPAAPSPLEEPFPSDL